MELLCKQYGITEAQFDHYHALVIMYHKDKADRLYKQLSRGLILLDCYFDRIVSIGASVQE